MANIKVIIPVHTYDEQVGAMLSKAVSSVPKEREIIIVVPKFSMKDEIIWILEEHPNVQIISPNEGSLDYGSGFCNLVNIGVENCNSEWFTILEFDDEFTDIWFKNVDEYIESDPDVSVFLPLTELIDFNDKKFIGYGNEAPWATSFSEEIGVIDNDCLQQYFDFNLTGSIFNVKDWNYCGGLKNSMKLVFWYEFLLRVTHLGKKIMVIPKLGYKHYVDRENSLFEGYRNTIDEKESEWWFETAKKESFYQKDRNKTYEKDKEN